MYVVGITGSIASGKSTFMGMLHGALEMPYSDLDLVARDIVMPGMPAYRRIADAFPSVIQEDLLIDRTKLGKIVFADVKERKKLAAMMRGPMIKTLGVHLFSMLCLKQQRVAIIVAPLLFESGLHWLCNYKVCLAVDTQVQLQRLMHRDQCSEEDALNRIKAQMPQQDKVSKSNAVVWNNGEPQEIAASVAYVGDWIRSRGGHVIKEDTRQEAVELDTLGGSEEEIEHLVASNTVPRESWVRCLRPTVLSLALSSAIIASYAFISLLFRANAWLCRVLLDSIHA